MTAAIRSAPAAAASCASSALRRDDYLCVMHRAEGKLVPAVTVDHILPVENQERREALLAEYNGYRRQEPLPIDTYLAAGEVTIEQHAAARRLQEVACGMGEHLSPAPRRPP